MQTFQVFYIERFEFDHTSLVARFFYSFDHIEQLIEEIHFSHSSFSLLPNRDGDTIDVLLFHISLALGVSYYKLFPTKNIVVESGILDTNAQIFWHKFYTLGLGEFFYTNNIDPTSLAQFSSQSNRIYSKQNMSLPERAIVPVGGGKDSIVTIEKILQSGMDTTLFTFGKENSIYQQTADISGQKRLLVSRRLSENLFRMNKEGYHNGHVPITGVISFVLTLVSYLYGYRYIVFSNEQSSNYGNLDFHGMEVNHQYSKSLEFENDFRSYLKEYISDGIIYFSMMRPYYEVAIIAQFVKYKKYHSVFTSCNNNFKLLEKTSKKDRWCCKCPKCAFVFACLHPYLTQDEMIAIFGRDMYTDETLIPLFRELAGVSGHKPFECVGTNEEILWSMRRSISLLDTNTLPIILGNIHATTIKQVPKETWSAIESRIFGYYPNNIPQIFLTV